MKQFIISITLFMTSLLGISANASADTPLPIDYWALRDTVSSVSLSPNGKYFSALQVECKECENVLTIYNTDDLSVERRLNADPMEIISANWVSDNYIFGTAWKVVRKRVGGPEEDVRSYTTFAYNFKKNKFSNVSGSFSIVSLLPNEPDAILISAGNAVTNGFGVDPFAAFRPRSYHKFDLKKGTTSLVLKGNEKYGNVSFDIDGNPRFASGYEAGSHEQVFYYRKPGETSWTEIERFDLDLHENLYRVLGGFQGFAGVDPNNPNIGYVIDNRDSDKAALWEFDFTTGKFTKKLYENPDADVISIQTHSMTWAGNNKLVAAIYPGAKMERHWFDQEEKALYQKFENAIPNAHQVRISGRSRDGKTMMVFNRGPKDPGSYWLVRDGKMQFLFSSNPLLKPENLAEVEYIRYTARDGQVVPAYVTKPKGKGPFPLIVLPHGGPHVNEVITYDEWGQFLANNGYMVLQPQYRMSVGWGKQHFDSAFGQHGLTMQDDKDDGALYLVQKGWADPDRIAMFGWSYGGYAALVAASREPNIYQCTIAGAAVADPKKSYLDGRGSNIKALDEWARARGGFVGINPIKEVHKVNIPVMMVHGDWDARVLYYHYKDYKKEIEQVAETKSSGQCTGDMENTTCTTTLYRKTGKSSNGVVPVNMNSNSQSEPYTGKMRFVTLEGADHFYRTLMYTHQKELYTEMLDFLKNDCGPGGL